MVEVTTICGEDEITWRVDMTVAQRKELHRRSCINAIPVGDGKRELVVVTHELLDVIVPGAISVDGVPNDELADWVWTRPQLHLDSLATQVGGYVYTGIDRPSLPAGSRGDEIPLPGPSASSAPPTGGSHPAAKSAADTTPNHTPPPENDG